ncbi:permease [Shewanella schlegeliana]|uniref:Permease n=1 Tax=Shewanella schlegeliana TaxID=190308 RepID=A0ABS1T122_9GAMM|nr:permease [Shewanella schlegeliana]MBL4914489.1 permease [Shewanella schlegeliana]MCL1109695.1 permease [Shewanella schlegeliana]
MEHSLSDLVIHLFSTFGNMVWQIYWPLAFGLILSSWIRNIIPVSSVVKHLGKTSLTSLTLTTVLGMVSSSCSYAAASLSHTLLEKKSTVANAMAFLVSSTNLILEMFIVLVALMGWTFLWGEILGGLILIVTVGFLFHRFYPKDVEQELRQHFNASQQATANTAMDMSKMKEGSCGADMDMSKMKEDSHGADMDMSKMKEGSCGADMDMSKMKEGSCGADMDMSKMKEGSCGADMGMSNMKQGGSGANMSAPEPVAGFMAKVSKSAGFFHMDIAMIGKEILIGVVISSILIAIVPLDGWRSLFISNDVALPIWLHSMIDVLIGIFVAMLAYVCSVGNLILAAALWHGGISFGGVIGFILSDVLTIPMIRVYTKYYGVRPTKWIVGLLFIAIFFTALCIDAIFNGFGWIIASGGERTINQAGLGWNFTTIMNLLFIPLSIWYYYLGKKTNANMHMSM